MTTIQEKIAIMQAFADGKSVECNFHGGWRGASTPTWNWYDREYRIKPLSKPSINWDHVHPDFKYLSRDNNGDIWLYKSVPKILGNMWIPTSSSGMGVKATTHITTPGDCDWKDSLVERPS